MPEHDPTPTEGGDKLRSLARAVDRRGAKARLIASWGQRFAVVLITARGASAESSSVGSGTETTEQWRARTTSDTFVSRAGDEAFARARLEDLERIDCQNAVLERSVDGGKTWEPVSSSPSAETTTEGGA